MNEFEYGALYHCRRCGAVAILAGPPATPDEPSCMNGVHAWTLSDYGATVIRVDALSLFRVVHENDHLRAQREELQRRNTELVHELRRVDRQRMVREFHVSVVGKTDPDYPGVPDDATVRLRLRLITEEYFELMRAAIDAEWMSAEHAGDHNEGCGLLCAESILLTAAANARIRVNLPEFVDATVDLDYVVEGTRGNFGVDSQGVWAEVHAANMAKAGGPRRESDGKQLKPPGWKPPDIAGELARQVEAAKKRERGPV